MLYHITDASTSYHIILYLLCNCTHTVARSNEIQSEPFLTNINLSRIPDTAATQEYRLRKKWVNKIVATNEWYHTLKHYFCHVLISRFSYVENLLHYHVVDFPVNVIKQFVSYFFGVSTNFIIEIPSILLFTLHKRRILHIMSWKCWYSMQVIGNAKNLCVFNFAILLKSRKFDAREIYMFYSICKSYCLSFSNQ